MTDHRLTKEIPVLVLIPTEMERDAILSHWSPPESLAVASVCGLGVVASSVNAVCAIERHQPRRVILAGIAGLFKRQTHGLGEAALFDAVTIDGVGVGQGHDFLSSAQLGWSGPQWGGPPELIPLPRPLEMQVQATTDHAESHQSSARRSSELLLTVCSATANSSEAEWRSERFPNAVAEDMEGYAVALACKTLERPLSIVRGFSNVVGERDKSKWVIGEALRSVANALKQMVGTVQ